MSDLNFYVFPMPSFVFPLCFPSRFRRDGRLKNPSPDGTGLASVVSTSRSLKFEDRTGKVPILRIQLSL
jgi:hypothetical protein